MTEKEALEYLYTCRPYLTRHEHKTIRGQIFAGDLEGVYKGLARLVEKRKHNVEWGMKYEQGRAAKENP